VTHVRATILLALLGKALAGQQESTAAVNIVHFNPGVVEVRQQGRLLGATPKTFNLPAGTQRLLIGQTEHCLYLSPRGTVELVLSAGKIASLTGALRCDEAWSEISLTTVPTSVTVRASEGEPQRRGQSVAVRVPLPGLTRLTFDAAQYARFVTDVAVGPKEVLTYRVRLGPAMPQLHSDSILERLPTEPEVPRAPVAPPEPVDPASALVNAENRLAILGSAKRADRAAKFGALVFLGGGIASLVTGAAVANDSLNLRPELRPPLYVSLAVAGAGIVVMLPSVSLAGRKGARAGCSSSGSAVGRTNCLRAVEGEVENLRAQSSTYPVRRSAWTAERARTDSIHRVATADYQRRRQTWTRLTTEAEQRNQQVARNRAENQRWLDAWRERARAAQGLDLVSRTPRR
jgi:hypothetical protein